MKFILFAITAIVVFQANAAEVLPLQHGRYSSSSCKDAANAALLYFDGKTLNGAHSNACKTTVRNEGKNVYVLHQTCPTEQVGSAAKAYELETDNRVEILSASSFRLTNNDNNDESQILHLCSKQ